MRSENAMMPQGASSVGCLGIGLVTTRTWSIRDGEARSMSGQSDTGAPLRTRNQEYIPDVGVFLGPSIRAIAPDVPPGETARPWPRFRQR